ncbi:MAG: two-component system sensor histidine kinase NtrB [Dissulfurimicrobium sp.]|uniref:two-component system sensor histidine kinase NtrB n=1 Tax=Dissulfurimicrobium TaxID=1769732 RepID=UPI001EDB93EE|nr:ATP-binding protein [Dissulfurimicrobium hydrothermale]UKL13623.1 GHKL domain-containing protein [Dissulfurimicrobium hydrothermale]
MAKINPPPAKEITQEFIEYWQEISQPAVIHIKDTIIVANEAFSTLFGQQRNEDVPGRSMADFISPWPMDTPRPGWRSAMGRRGDGSNIDIEVVCLPLSVSSGILHQSLIKDVSEIKSWEDKLLQAERLTAMGKLAGEIAHEINNPLGGILLYANLIKEELNEEDVSYENIGKIIKLATRCRIIAKGLLNFGRSSSKSYAPVDLNQIIKDVYALIEDHHILKNIEVDMRFKKDLPHFMGDKGQIEQAILNLIINAGEALNNKGKLIIETDFSKEQRLVCLTVEDNGPGIPDDLLPRIFEPFFTTKRAGKGTGLGLSITHGIVQRHGGKITVNSKPGYGTRFEVKIPLSGGG